MASADSVAQGLAQSQNTIKKHDFNEYEDPARCWIDLVLAFKASNPNSVRAVLTQAKASHWTHDLYNTALQEAADASDDDEDRWATDDDIKSVKEWQEINAAQEDYWEE